MEKKIFHHNIYFICIYHRCISYIYVYIPSSLYNQLTEVSLNISFLFLLPEATVALRLKTGLASFTQYNNGCLFPTFSFLYFQNTLISTFHFIFKKFCVGHHRPHPQPYYYTYILLFTRGQSRHTLL